jgi:hypothetical protein
MEHPARRPASDFKHHPLEHWVDHNRGDLLWACLTLGQAWVAKGRPPFSGARTMGTFEAWVRVIGGILDVAGLGEHFLANQDQLFEAMDLEMQPWRDFVTAWHVELDGDLCRIRAIDGDVVEHQRLLYEELFEHIPALMRTHVWTPRALAERLSLTRTVDYVQDGWNIFFWKYFRRGTPQWRWSEYYGWGRPARSPLVPPTR